LISGTCSFGLARLTIGPLGRDLITTLMGANSPSAFTIVMRKPILEIILVDFLERHEYLQNTSVCGVIDCRKAYLVTQREEEWNFVHKEKVGSDIHLFVEFQ
jgi:hypothetical protein